MTRERKRPSEVLYMPTMGFGVSVRSRAGIRVIPKRPAAMEEAAVAHMAVPSRELSTMDGSPVRSRW